MSTNALSEALIREHDEIDAGVEAFAGQGDVQALRGAIVALRRHIYLEEEFVFPPLKEAGMMMSIFVMLREHGEIWDAMDTIEQSLDNGTGSDSIRDTCLGLLAVLSNHNAKEEPIIYPQADALLSPDAIDRLQQFIASGRMPEGWRCEKAAAIAE